MSEDTQGKIRAGVVGSAVVNGVERVEGDEVELGMFAKQPGEVEKICKIATAPVALAAERGQEAVDAVEGTISRRKMTAVGGEDPADFCLTCGGTHVEGVVTGGCESGEIWVV